MQIRLANPSEIDSLCFMSVLEVAIKELKTLPPSKQDEAAKFIHSLHTSAVLQKEAILEKTFGCLSQAEADEWESAVKECSKIDHEDW
jgi:hypothetical protein